jgi:hypothetical protein
MENHFQRPLIIRQNVHRLEAVIGLVTIALFADRLLRGAQPLWRFAADDTGDNYVVVHFVIKILSVALERFNERTSRTHSGDTMF